MVFRVAGERGSLAGAAGAVREEESPPEAFSPESSALQQALSLSQASAAAAAPCRLQQPAFSAFPRRCVAGKGKEGVLRLDHHRHN